jgi:hypothetical protein
MLTKLRVRCALEGQLASPVAAELLYLLLYRAILKFLRLAKVPLTRAFSGANGTRTLTPCLQRDGIAS